ncbi:MAG: hypothetical protein IKQ84_06200 [Spirochaetaceae bacterium]|nr:hypothetical protein [Spirochaetaceae bacterium]
MLTALMLSGVCRRKRTALTEHKTAFTMKTVKLSNILATAICDSIGSSIDKMFYGG